MRKIIFLISFLTIIFQVAGAAELKKSVLLVQPEYSDLSDFLSEYSFPLARQDFRAESRTFMSLLDGVTGSGVVVEQDGKKVLLTNRHVVGFAHRVTLRIKDGQQKIRYRHCPVIAISPLTDIAMVALPDTADLVPVPLAETDVQDAEDIWAAGYPGLGGKPEWQLTNGIVSNSALYRSELLGKQQAAIQHTAPIDPGSSGGALLRRVDEDNYVLVGLNTWKAGNRDGVGIAIPVSALRHFLEHGNEQPTKTDEELSEEWNALLREDYVQAAEAFSVDYLMLHAAEDWEDVYLNMGYTYQKSIRDIDRTSSLDVLRLSWAIDALRFALAGGEEARFVLKWDDVQGRRMIVGVHYPDLNKKQYHQATCRLRK